MACGVWLAGIAVVIWWRNRDILRDIFDYSIIAAAAGKVEAGFKPYVDIYSPMQSAIYLLNVAAEAIGGRTYLGLTWGGLIQAIGGGWLLLGLLWRPAGALLAMATAMAVMLAGSLQHVIFFYNPVGITCLGVVVIGLASEPALQLKSSWRAWVVLGACFLGGINKLNFQGVTLAMAGLITIAAWLENRILFRSVWCNAMWLAVFGLGLPLGFELAWTGVDLKTWLAQVVFGPTARLDYLGQALGFAMYWRPVHDFHAYVLVPCIAGVGLALVAVMGGWLFFSSKPARWLISGWIMRGLLIVSAWLGGAAIMITNHETVVLTSLVFPLAAVSFYMLYRRAGNNSGTTMRCVLVVAMACWVITGGYAAWQGSRVLYGHNPPARSSYVPFKSPIPSLAYFENVRMLPEQIEAMVAAARRLESMEDAAGLLPPILFAQGQEWFERAYPLSLVRGAPVWLHDGTTLHDGDASLFLKITDNGHRRILVQRDWQSWPPIVQAILSRDYLPEVISGRDLLYHPKGIHVPEVLSDLPMSPSPFDFRNETASAILLSATRWSSDMRLLGGVKGRVFGATNSSNWTILSGANELVGVAEVATVGRHASGVVTRSEHEQGPLLWEMPVALDHGQKARSLQFEVQAQEKPIWLQIIVPDELTGQVNAGWRELRIPNSNSHDSSPPAPFQPGLAGIVSAKPREWRDAFWYEIKGAKLDAGSDLPAEYWQPGPVLPGALAVSIELRAVAENSKAVINVALVWYRAGRFEYLFEQLVHFEGHKRLAFRAWTPEAGGWIGILARGNGGLVQNVAIDHDGK